MTIELFPTPISNYQTDLNVDEIANYLRSLEWNTSYNVNGGDQTKNNTLQNDPFFSTLTMDILEAVNMHCDVVGFKKQQFKITQMWGNRYERDCNIHIHSHSNSFVSGVFNVKGTQEDCTIFINPLNTKEYINVSKKENLNNYLIQHYRNIVPQGTITIFPSWLEHTSSPSADNERFTISFNVLPLTLGEPEALNYVKLW